MLTGIEAGRDVQCQVVEVVVKVVVEVVVWGESCDLGSRELPKPKMLSPPVRAECRRKIQSVRRDVSPSEAE